MILPLSAPAVPVVPWSWRLEQGPEASRADRSDSDSYSAGPLWRHRTVAVVQVHAARCTVSRPGPGSNQWLQDAARDHRTASSLFLDFALYQVVGTQPRGAISITISHNPIISIAITQLYLLGLRKGTDY